MQPRLALPSALAALALALPAAAQTAPEPAPAITADAAAEAPAVVVAGVGESLPMPGQPLAGEVPLSEPIAPVPPGQPAWNLEGSVLAGIADPFYDKVAVVGALRRGFGRWSVEGFGGRAFSWASAALDLCQRPGSCTRPTQQQLGATPGQLDWLGGVAGVYRIGNAKLSFGGLEAFRFHLEGNLGAAAVGYRFTDGTERSAFAPGARLGLGLGVDLGGGFAARGDLQSLLYRSEIRGNAALERQLFLGASLAWRPGGAP